MKLKDHIRSSSGMCFVSMPLQRCCRKLESWHEVFTKFFSSAMMNLLKSNQQLSWNLL